MQHIPLTAHVMIVIPVWLTVLVLHAHYYNYYYSHVDTTQTAQQIVQYAVQVTVNLLVISVLSVFVVAEVQL
jgi:hypothetical protein